MHTRLSREGTVAVKRKALDDKRAKIRAGALSILVVDEERLFCEILCEVFQRQGHLATFCSNSLEAIDKARDGAFDVVVLDVNMPDMDGHEALGILRHAFSKTPLTIITRADRVEVADAALAESSLPCLFTPVTISQAAEMAGGVFGDRRGHDGRQH